MNRNLIVTKLKTAFSGSRVVCRAISSFTLLAFVNLCIRPQFTDISTLGEVRLAPSLFLFAAIFLLLSAAALAFHTVNTDSFALPVGALLDAFMLCSGFYYRSYADKLLFALAATLFLTLALIYFRTQNHRLFLKISINNKWILLGSAAAAAIFIGTTIAIASVIRYELYYTPNFDFGIFAQAFRNMKAHGLPLTTCERDRLFSHFSVHISPILYLLLPVYAIFPSPVTLQVSQALLIAGGAFPLFFICRKRGLSGLHTCLFMALYALFPAISTGTNYDFHENCFLLPLLLLAFWALEYDKMIPFYVSALLVLAVKEDAFIYIIILALFMIAEKRRRLHALIISAVGVLYFVFCVFMLSRYGEGVMAGRYANLLPYGEGGLTGILRTFVLDPGYVLSQIFTGGEPFGKLMYFLLMFLPLGFLPFASKKPARWLLTALVAMNLIADSIYQYDIGFQYGFGVAAFLFYAAVLNFSELTEKARTALITLALASCLTLWPLFYGAGMRDYIGDAVRDGEKCEVIDSALETIPEEASVAASTFMLAHVCNRDTVYEIFYHKDLTEVEYVVFDMRPGYIEDYDIYYEYLLANGYEVTVNEPELVLIMHRTE